MEYPVQEKLHIGWQAFLDCVTLTGVMVPDSVSAIRFSAFAGCTNLAAVVLGSGVTLLDASAFDRTPALAAFSVAAANPAFAVQDGVLFSKDAATLVRYPSGKAGTSYTIPASVETLRDRAFSGSVHLEGIGLPEGLLEIGSLAFTDCLKLRTLAIPGTVVQLGGDPFAGCAALEQISVAPDNPCYRSVDGVLLTKDQTELVRFPPAHGSAEYAIPNGVTNIRNNAFLGGANLRKVTLPEGIIRLQGYSFAGCSNLVSITLPASVTILGSGVFSSCSKLASILCKGDRPLESWLGSAAYTVVYYLPGTAGWESTFGGRPTRLWNPRVAQDAAFGFAEGSFDFTIEGEPWVPFVVEACDALSPGSWTPVRTNRTGSTGLYHFSDPAAAGAPARFYRFVWPDP